MTWVELEYLKSFEADDWGATVEEHALHEVKNRGIQQISEAILNWDPSV